MAWDVWTGGADVQKSSSSDHDLPCAIPTSLEVQAGEHDGVERIFDLTVTKLGTSAPFLSSTTQFRVVVHCDAQ